MNYSNKALTLTESRIVAVIANHVGKENAITSKAIAEKVGVKDREGTPVTRGQIKDVLEKTRLPIGACNKGYFVLANDDEAREYLRNLEDRANAIDARARFVAQAYRQWYDTDDQPFRV